MLIKFQNFAIPESMKGLNYVPFREMIRLFLQELTEVKQEVVNGVKIWSTLVVNEPNGVNFPLYIVEEAVQSSINPFCDHCKFAGWGHHYVSKRRYHLVIPEEDRWDKKLKFGFSELRTHILYGLIHCNGYGHLICINGFKVDSNIFCESDLMDFWDRLCSSLNTRKISVCDSLKEGMMDLRLLHVVAFGQSWFGKWGFKFSLGSYAVTEQKYETAVQFLSSLGLDKIVSDFRDKVAGRHIKKIIDKYREVSDTPLITTSDLFKFMLGFKPRGSTRSGRKEAVIQSSTKQDLKALEKPLPMNFGTLVTSLTKSCRWSARRIEHVLMEVVNFLKEKKANGDGKRGISRQELRDEIRKCVGDTGLIDFVLKSIKCFTVGNHVIRRSINSSTKKYQFKIQQVARETQPTRFLLSSFTPDCRWHGKTVKHAEEVISLLKANCDKNAMSLQELQEKARESDGDSGLIAFVLESVSDNAIGNQIIPGSKHASTKRVEFSIKDVPNLGVIGNLEGLPRLEIAYERDVYEDVLFLYSNVLFGYKKSDSVSMASRIVIDSKQFVKEWLLEDQEMGNQLMALTCQVLPSFEELETELTRPLTPGEVVVIPLSITVNELKGFAQSAFRDVYCIMDKFVVKQIGGLRAIEDDKVLSCTMEPNGHVWIRGSGLDLDTKLRYEGGTVKLIVDCICGCGTKTEDGEMMIPCVVCQVWQHTRCNGIDDDEDAPSVFKCARCSNI